MKGVDAIMTIRELKKMTDDPRIKRFLQYFWNCEIPVTSLGPLDRVYRYELSKVASFQNLNEVYETIKRVYCKHIDHIQKYDRGLYGSQCRYMKELCRRVTGHSFKSDCLDEETRLEKKKRADEKQRLRDERYKQLAFLYPLFELQPLSDNPKKDLVRNIVRRGDITAAILSHKEEIIADKTLLYDIAADIIIPRAETKAWAYGYYEIMCGLSFFIHKDRSYWLKVNHLEGKNLRGQTKEKTND